MRVYMLGLLGLLEDISDIPVGRLGLLEEVSVRVYMLGTLGLLSFLMIVVFYERSVASVREV